METNNFSGRHRRSLSNLRQLLDKEDDEIHTLFPKVLQHHRISRITSMAIQIKKNTAKYIESQQSQQRYDSNDQEASDHHDKIIRKHQQVAGFLPPMQSSRSMPDLIPLKEKIDLFQDIKQEEDLNKETTTMTSLLRLDKQDIKINFDQIKQNDHQNIKSIFFTPVVKLKNPKSIGLDSAKNPIKTITNNNINNFIHNYQQKLGIHHTQQQQELDKLKQKVRNWKAKQAKKNQRLSNLVESQQKIQGNFLARVQETSGVQQSSHNDSMYQQRQLIKPTKFYSQNVSMTSDLSTQVTNANTAEYPKNFVQEFNQQEERLLNRLKDGIKLTGQDTFIHNTLKQLFRRTSIVDTNPSTLQIQRKGSVDKFIQTKSTFAQVQDGTPKSLSPIKKGRLPLSRHQSNNLMNFIVPLDLQKSPKTQRFLLNKE